MSLETLRKEIVKHKQVEADLHIALGFVEGILETVREPMVVLDAELRVSKASPSFYQTFKLNEEETVGRFIYELGSGAWNIPRLRTLLEEILPQNNQFNDFEVEQDFKHIGVKTMLLNARRINHDGNQTLMILLAIEDVTERRRTEAAIQIYTKKLEWSNRELQEFAYIASHDLQEPLRAVASFSDRLLSKHGDALGEDGRDYLDRMQRAAGRMRVLVQDLLAYSRISSKARPFKSVNLAKMAQHAVSDLSTRLEETGGQVDIGMLQRVEGDETQLRQLLQNLIDNGLKFHAPDVPPRIAISSSSKPKGGVDCVELLVEDNGIGFDTKYCDRIFTPFQRLHTRQAYAGTGIGLAVCRKIAERHGGSITAESAPGQGATFIVMLPARQPEGVALI